MEHTFTTDTFISTFSPTKLDFFKEELPLSSLRAKGYLFKSQYYPNENGHVHTRTYTHISYIQFSRESTHDSPTDKEKEEENSTLESSYHLHSLVVEATCLSRTLAEWTGTRFA